MADRPAVQAGDEARRSRTNRDWLGEGLETGNAMTNRRSRREFMGLTAAGVAGLLARSSLGAGVVERESRATHGPQGSQGSPPNLLVINAKVFTMDPVRPRAEAFVTSGSRLVAVGSAAEVRSLAPRGAQTFDAKGMTIVPGFIDCHNHAGGTTLLYEVLVGNP